MHNLARAIEAAAAQTPLMIVLEDLHRADDGTLLALRSLATACPSAPVLWVLTTRTGAGGPAVHRRRQLCNVRTPFPRVAATAPMWSAER